MRGLAGEISCYDRGLVVYWKQSLREMEGKE